LKNADLMYICSESLKTTHNQNLFFLEGVVLVVFVKWVAADCNTGFWSQSLPTFPISREVVLFFRQYHGFGSPIRGYRKTGVCRHSAKTRFGFLLRFYQFVFLIRPKISRR